MLQGLDHVILDRLEATQLKLFLHQLVTEDVKKIKSNRIMENNVAMLQLYHDLGIFLSTLIKIENLE